MFSFWPVWPLSADHMIGFLVPANYIVMRSEGSLESTLYVYSRVHTTLQWNMQAGVVTKHSLKIATLVWQLIKDHILEVQLVGALSPVNHKGLYQGWGELS